MKLQILVRKRADQAKKKRKKKGRSATPTGQLAALMR